ncbi:uncharacterized protein PG986_005054 [Apiospora aurea]|uniref:Uncharacterized protein n=1 Tax=Apiospora aurea TaxID=335848 RepID=A0ABR1QGG7_9PEZI
MGVQEEWGQFEWVIRPMPLSRSKAEGEDGTQLKIQFLYLNTDEDPLHAESIYGTRKAQPICAGDVYVLETKDPVNHPLPSRDLLLLQFCMDRFRHALKAKRALKSLFRHPPPHVDPNAIQSGSLSREPNGFWEGVVKDAVEAKVLSEDDGHKWILGMREWEEEKRRKKEEEDELRLRRVCYEESEEDTE